MGENLIEIPLRNLVQAARALESQRHRTAGTAKYKEVLAVSQQLEEFLQETPTMVSVPKAIAEIIKTFSKT